MPPAFNSFARALKQRVQICVQWFWRFTQRRKRRCLGDLSTPTAVWIETGTFRGDTTAYLATCSARVHTIEPAEELFRAALRRFEGNPRIKCHGGTSERLLASVLEEAVAKPGEPQPPLRIFLDGHFSGGKTFQGSTSTPIRLEMDLIASRLSRLKDVVVIIDDARLFGPQPGEYPSAGEVSKWAEENGLNLALIQDMFVMRRTSG